MTQPNEPQTQPATAPENLLFALLINLLAPMFLGVAMGDIVLAQAAAAHTVNDFRASNRVDLIAIAQIIAFGLAALGSLSPSFGDDVSVSMALRLRGNANACNRSAEQNRRARDRSQCHHEHRGPLEAAAPQNTHLPDTHLPDTHLPDTHLPDTHLPDTQLPGTQLPDIELPDTQLPDTELPNTEPPESPAPEPFLTEAAEQLLAAESAARLQPHPIPQSDETAGKAARAADLMKQALDLRARIPSLPKAGRKAAIDRITKLTNTARLLTGARA